MIFPASDILSFLIFLSSMQNGYFPIIGYRETQINPNLALCHSDTACEWMDVPSAAACERMDVSSDAAGDAACAAEV